MLWNLVLWLIMMVSLCPMLLTVTILGLPLLFFGILLAGFSKAFVIFAHLLVGLCKAMFLHIAGIVNVLIVFAHQLAVLCKSVLLGHPSIHGCSLACSLLTCFLQQSVLHFGLLGAEIMMLLLLALILAMVVILLLHHYAISLVETMRTSMHDLLCEGSPTHFMEQIMLMAFLEPLVLLCPYSDMLLLCEVTMIVIFAHEMVVLAWRSSQSPQCPSPQHLNCGRGHRRRRHHHRHCRTPGHYRRHGKRRRRGGAVHQQVPMFFRTSPYVNRFLIPYILHLYQYFVLQSYYLACMMK